MEARQAIPRRSATAPTLRERWARCAEAAERLVGHTLLAALARLSIAGIFFMSGRTKVEGLLSVTPTAIGLFRDEYKLPLVSPELAAHLAAYAEHLFPALLALGLLTRFSAAALLGMTLVIQVFVYPSAWPTHLSWAALLLYLIGRGGGRLSVDYALQVR